MTEDRKQVEEQVAREPQDGRLAGRTAGEEEEKGEGAGTERQGSSPRESAAGSSDELETRLPLESGEGPRAPQGDALLDGSGSRHGVDSRDERPGGR